MLAALERNCNPKPFSRAAVGSIESGMESERPASRAKRAEVRLSLLSLCFFCVWSSWAMPVWAQTPTLRLAHPQALSGLLPLEGVSGSSAEISVFVEIEVPAGDTSVVGWTVALGHDPSLELLSASVEGTAGDIPGFSRVETVSGGVICTASLLSDPSRKLLPGTKANVLFVRYRGAFPAKDTTNVAWLRVVDGLVGSQGAVNTRVELDGPGGRSLVSPRREDLRILLTGFEYSDLFDLELRQRGAPPADKVYDRVIPGSTATYALEAVLRSRLPPGETSGAQGWSLSVAHDGSVFAVRSLSIVGTSAGAAMADGFERHEIVESGTGQGFVSAVVLSFTRLVSLPPRGEASLLRATYDLVADTSVEGTRIETQVAYRDGLRGAGQPVNNVITYRGSSHRPRAQRGIWFDIEVGYPTVQAFVRGDTNSDGRVNIADAVWLVSELFFLGPRGRCFYAGDVNGDGRKDLSDVAFLLYYQFLGGSEPPRPFPHCGVIDGQDPARCPAGSSGCQ